jgi:hypothetical protein
VLTHPEQAKRVMANRNHVFYDVGAVINRHHGVTADWSLVVPASQGSMQPRLGNLMTAALTTGPIQVGIKPIVILFCAAVCLLANCVCEGATAEPFKPVKERITVSTNMTPVDVEVIGSTSLLRQFHRLIPELAVRFRLERAYIDQLFVERDPGFEILSIGVDLETASPMSLFQAVMAGPRFGRGISGIPKLEAAEARRRNVVLGIQSDHRAEYVRKLSDRLVACRGESLGNGLWAYAPPKSSDCPRNAPQRFGRVAELDDSVITKIDCDESLPVSWARCYADFPYQGFTVHLGFDRELLPRWREVVGFAGGFLKSKQYQRM